MNLGSNDTETAPAPPLITEERNCAFCDYNLLHQPLDGVCPECGEKIRLSLEGGFVAHADPLWVAQLTMGTVMGVLWCCAMSLRTVIELTIIREWLSAIFDGAWLASTMSLSYWLGSYAFYLAAWLTASTTCHHGEPWKRYLARAIRVLVVALAILEFLIPQWAHLAHPSLPLSMNVLGVAATVAYLLRVRHLAPLVADAFLIRHAPILLFVSAGSLLLLQIGPWMITIRDTRSVLLAEVLRVGVLIYGAVVLWRVFQALRKSAIAARDNWHKQG